MPKYIEKTGAELTELLPDYQNIFKRGDGKPVKLFKPKTAYVLEYEGVIGSDFTVHSVQTKSNLKKSYFGELILQNLNK